MAERAKALADPTRLTLAAALADADELCVCDLAWVAEQPETWFPTTCASCGARSWSPAAATARW